MTISTPKFFGSVAKNYRQVAKNLMSSFLLFVSCLLFPISSIYALDFTRANNKFGIHLAQPHEGDINRAAELVNSSGGKWGYVTLVIQENDRDKNKWQDILERLRERHLIPIIRLATQPEGAKWRRPNKEDAAKWAEFLDSLNWVVKDRYIVLFNEPNHGAEWGGEVNPETYVEISHEFAKKLKEKNKDFFIMMAGLDSAAPSSPPNYEDEAIFLRRILNSKFEILNSIDGWSSHSYPNHGYIGSPYDSGRNTIRNYAWELDYLKQIGVEKELPVFITETGWPHSAQESSVGGRPHNQNYYSADVAGAYTEIAYKNTWLEDPIVRAVTPFVLNYQGEPFAQFSWTKPGEQETYSHYQIVKNIAKIAGSPEQIDQGSLYFLAPRSLLVRSNYRFRVGLNNRGQTIWDKKEGYYLEFEDIDKGYYQTLDVIDIKPQQTKEVEFTLKTDDKTGTLSLRPILYRNGIKISEGNITNAEKKETLFLKIKYFLDSDKNGYLDAGDLFSIIRLRK